MGTDECIVTILYIVRKSLILQKSALLCPNIVFNLQYKQQMGLCLHFLISAYKYLPTYMGSFPKISKYSENLNNFRNSKKFAIVIVIKRLVPTIPCKHSEMRMTLLM